MNGVYYEYFDTLSFIGLRFNDMVQLRDPVLVFTDF